MIDAQATFRQSLWFGLMHVLGLHKLSTAALRRYDNGDR
jgi:hypothetical protein